MYLIPPGTLLYLLLWALMFLPRSFWGADLPPTRKLTEVEVLKFENLQLKMQKAQQDYAAAQTALFQLASDTCKSVGAEGPSCDLQPGQVSKKEVAPAPPDPAKK